MRDLLDPDDLPHRFDGVEELHEFMTRPSRALVEDLGRIDGDIIILGVGGKMGPTLARLAKRAAPDRRVVGVARFSDGAVRDDLEAHGVETVACDLLERDAVAALPKLPNVIFMAGRKFGSGAAEELTWAMNVHVPALVAETFHRSRIVAFSTGCVYPFVPVDSQGATEEMPATPPPGEYANSCVGRERMFQYFSERHGTPGCLIRLNYAIDMRYGVLYDVAARVAAGEPVALAMGHVNVIWQGDACAMALRALRHCAVPPRPVNVTGPETVSVRWLAEAFGRRLDREPVLSGVEDERVWLANSALAASLFGYPSVPLDRMVDWVADWVARGKSSLDRPTHFEVRDGNY